MSHRRSHILKIAAVKTTIGEEIFRYKVDVGDGLFALMFSSINVSDKTRQEILDYMAANQQDPFVDEYYYIEITNRPLSYPTNEELNWFWITEFANEHIHP